MLPDLSVFWVVGLVLALAVILDRLVFKPILQVIKKREDAVTAARVLADQAAAEARAAAEEFERKTQAARAGIYRQMDEMRQAALADRTALVEATRKEAESALAEATTRLAQEVAAARATLDQDAQALAADATSQILGRRS